MDEKAQSSNEESASDDLGAAVDGAVEVKANEGIKNEVSAYAVTRMMGIATTTELRILENKFDLVSNRITSMGAKLDRIVSMFQQMPTGSDLERIDVQIGSLKQLIRDIAVMVSKDAPIDTKKRPTSAATPPPAAETQIITAGSDIEESAPESN